MKKRAVFEVEAVGEEAESEPCDCCGVLQNEHSGAIYFMDLSRPFRCKNCAESTIRTLESLGLSVDFSVGIN